MKTRVYLQSESLPDVQLVEVDFISSAKTLKAACMATLPEDVRQQDFHLFEEENEFEIGEHDIEQLNKQHGVRLHLHRCKHVGVTVRFMDKTVQKKYAPSATIGRVKKWAAHELCMAPNDAAEHVLQIAGTTQQPDVDVHIGTFAKCPECAVDFDLVPAHRING